MQNRRSVASFDSLQQKPVADRTKDRSSRGMVAGMCLWSKCDSGALTQMGNKTVAYHDESMYVNKQ